MEVPGWWKMLVFVAFVQLVYVSASVPQMSLVREWESMDLLVPGDGGQGTSRRSLSLYVDTEFIMLWRLDVYKDRLFVGFHGTKALFWLAYHNLSDTSRSLLLQPYPSWDAHSDEHGDRQIYIVRATCVDRCHRLWVIDILRFGVDEHRIIVFDLATDRILRKHTFRLKPEYINMAVDDDDCENPYLYITYFGRQGIWTYSWAEETMWHHPGDSYITGMVIAPNKNNYSIVYYNKNVSKYKVWYISTRYLRDKTSNMSDFEHRGEQPSHFLDWTALDAKSNVLFSNPYQEAIRAYPCWNRYERCEPSGWHDIAVNTTHNMMSHIMLDNNGNLWALTRRLPFEDNQINLSIFSVAITSVTAELNKNDTTNTTKLNEIAAPATDPGSSTTVQSDVDYDGINNATATIEETTDGTPSSDITATYPASSTTEQASGVDYNGSSNTTVTILDITVGTPNSTITATDPVSSTTEQASGVDYNGSSNTTVTTEETLAVTPNSTITATDPVSSTKMQASGVNYDRISNTIATAQDTIVGTPNSNINTQANSGTKLTQFANILFSFTNSSLIFSNFTVNYSPSNNVN